MLRLPKVRQKLYDIAACVVCEQVDILFLRIDLHILLLVIMGQKRDGLADIPAGCVKLGGQHVIAAVQGERGRCEESRVECVQLVLVPVLRDGRVLHDAPA